MSSELARRVAVAVVGIPVVFACLWAGGWVLGILMAIAALLGVREFHALARAQGAKPFEVVGLAGAPALVLLAVALPAPEQLAPTVAGGVMATVVLLLGAAVWARGPDGHPLASVSHTVFGVLYVGGTLAFVPLLRALDGVGGSARGLMAAGFVILPLVVTWVGDSIAYFVGRAFGRRKLAPRASPGKTIEGAVAGLAGAGAAGVVVAWWLGLGGHVSPTGLAWMGPWWAAGIGVAVGAAGQVGDLAESVLKRGAGVKDSGTLLPGHGGVLDRIDALLFAFPVCWALLALAGLAP